MHHFVNLDNVSNVMLSRNDIKLHVDSITLDKKTNKERKESDRYTYNYMVCSLFDSGVHRKRWGGGESAFSKRVLIRYFVIKTFKARKTSKLS